MNNKVYVVVSTIVNCFGYTETFVSKVLSTMGKAESRVREEFEIQMAGIKDNHSVDWEDYCEGQFDTFEEYWEDFVDGCMACNTRYVYQDDDGLMIEVAVLEADFE